MNDIKKYLGGMFNRAASLYDSSGPRFFTWFGKELAAFAGIKAGSRILDIASGRGAVLFPAAEIAGKMGRVTGIDISEAMVMETSRDIIKRKITNAEALCMDAENLNFPSSSFDFVLCGFGIFFFPDFERALSEIKRVLKPGGIFAFSTWAKANERRKWINDLVKKYLPQEEITKAGRLLPKGFDNPAQIEIILKDSGFNSPVIIMKEMDFVYADEDEWWKVQWSHGIRSFLERVERVKGRSGLNLFKEEALEYIGRTRNPDGIHQIMKAYFTKANIGAVSLDIK